MRIDGSGDLTTFRDQVLRDDYGLKWQGWRWLLVAFLGGGLVLDAARLPLPIDAPWRLLLGGALVLAALLLSAAYLNELRETTASFDGRRRQIEARWPGRLGTRSRTFGYDEVAAIEITTTHGALFGGNPMHRLEARLSSGEVVPLSRRRAQFGRAAIEEAQARARQLLGLG